MYFNFVNVVNFVTVTTNTGRSSYGSYVYFSEFKNLLFAVAVFQPIFVSFVTISAVVCRCFEGHVTSRSLTLTGPLQCSGFHCLI